MKRVLNNVLSPIQRRYFTGYLSTSVTVLFIWDPSSQNALQMLIYSLNLVSFFVRLHTRDKFCILYIQTFYCYGNVLEFLPLNTIPRVYR